MSDPTVQAIVSDASHGLSVLAVCTTVGRAQDLWWRLRQRLGAEVELLHGRFHSEDRFRKERRLCELRGSGKQEPVVLVATQVVEVSLDVDFDVLYCDPAPLEALVQRFGRVNRRRRSALRDVHVMTGIPDGSPVYPDSLVHSAIAVLGEVHGKALDEGSVQRLVDTIYSSEFGDGWRRELEREIEVFESRVLGSLKPFESDEGLEDAFERMFDGFEVLPKSLEELHEERLKTDPLQAPGLHVPITRGQYFSLKQRGLIEWKKGTCIANCRYTPEFGLEIRDRPGVDGV